MMMGWVSTGQAWHSVEPVIRYRRLDTVPRLAGADPAHHHFRCSTAGEEDTG